MEKIIIVSNISFVHESILKPDAAASKDGMEMLTKNTAMDVADKGIRVNDCTGGHMSELSHNYG